jgi:SpoVK/Ycf46/Vps4 family AAA+-type ATPase
MKKKTQQLPKKIKVPPKKGAQLEKIATEKRQSPKKGMIILFYGTSNSGKTQAAEILAGKIDIPLYRIDLSSVVSKYIGETEKNLRKVFDAAKIQDIILFFDEADALFGSRTEVGDAHDKFAQTALDKLKRLGRMVILSTKDKKKIKQRYFPLLHTTLNFSGDEEDSEDK